MKVNCIIAVLLLLTVHCGAQVSNKSLTPGKALTEKLDFVLKQSNDVNSILGLGQIFPVCSIEYFQLPDDFSVTNTENRVLEEKEQLGNFKWHIDDSISPVKKSHSLIPVVAISYGAVTYLCYRLLDTRIQKFSQENKTRFQTFISNSVSGLGLGMVQSIGLGGTTIVAFATKNKKLQQTVIIWAGSLLINSIVTDQLKISFQRHRPNSGDPYNTFDWRKGPKLNKSFSSAHTSNAFTTATVFATQYKTAKWVPPVAYTLASLVGLSRIYDNAHWASDVLAGAAVGFLSVKAMNIFYKWAKKKLLFLPQAGISYSSLSIVYKF